MSNTKMVSQLMDKHEISSHAESLNEKVSYYLTTIARITNLEIQCKLLERVKLTLSCEDFGEEPKWAEMVGLRFIKVKSEMDLATLEAKYLLKEILKMYEILNFPNFRMFRLDLQNTSSALKEEAWDTYKLKKTNKFKSLVSRKSKRNTEATMKQFMKLMNKEEILEADFIEAMEVLDRLQ